MPSPSDEALAPLSTCFACGAAVDAVPGISARPACPTCRARARLVAGGALLKAVMASGRPYPLEGSGLNTLLNPVEVDGRRAWVDFAAGGYGVFEEVLPSADWFDFSVQHSRLWDHVLRHVSTAPPPAGHRLDEIAALVASAAPLSSDLPNIELLEHWWRFTQAGLRVLAAHGPIRTNDEAWSVAEARRSPGEDDSSAARAALLQRLADLAERGSAGVHRAGADGERA